MANAEELRNLAIEWLSMAYSDAIIVPELSVADGGQASIDVAAITPTEIVGVEIKGAGDSPSRLPLQGAVYGRVARRMWLLPDESIRDRCFAKRPQWWGRLQVKDGKVRPLNLATKCAGWKPCGYGERSIMVPDEDNYRPDEADEIKLICPYSMLGTLWREELIYIARKHKVQVSSRATVPVLCEAIVMDFPAPEIHRMMIEALRNRRWSFGKTVIMPQQKLEPSDA